MRPRLPPLPALLAFESAARHLSFSLAAQELCISQSALSRRVQGLETWLSVQLFHRQHRFIQLTPAGMDYFAQVHNWLQLLHDGTQELRVKYQHIQKTITIAATSAVATMWLFPRVAAFQAHCPNVDLRVLACDQVNDLSEREFDLAIGYYQDPIPASRRLLFRETVVPVASPHYIEQLGDLHTPSDLLQATLLQLDDGAPQWISWTHWFSAQGYKFRRPSRLLSFNLYTLVIQAALAAEGVALAWRGLVDEPLALGQLVEMPQFTPMSRGAFCLRLGSRERPPEAQTLVDWLCRP